MAKLEINNMSELEEYLIVVTDHYFRPHWTIGRYVVKDGRPFFYNNYNGNETVYVTLEGLAADLHFSFPMVVDDQRHEKTEPIKIAKVTPLEHLRSQFDLSIGLYNTEDYASPQEAHRAGAIYPTRSYLTNYGPTWLYDIKEIVEAASTCYTNECGTYCLVFEVEGVWYELTTELIEEV